MLSIVFQFNKLTSLAKISLCIVFLKNAEYKKSERKDIKRRKMILVAEEEDLQNWTRHYQDGLVRIPPRNRSIC